MQRYPSGLGLALSIGLLAAPLHAGEAATGNEPPAPDFGLKALAERFEAAAPEIGEPVPDLSVYDADGKRVAFRDLVEGHFSVVVFGCLT